MTIEPPAAGEPRRPSGPRNPGDAWVVSDAGERYWGRFGAAGLLAVDAERGILLQHRVEWSHFGGTWGLPGGALHEGESAVAGAIREAQEEAGVPDGAVRTRFTSRLDREIWSYTTVVADVVEPFEPTITDPESVALEWVPLDDVTDRELHPGFEKAWPMLRDLLNVKPVIVVDAANVVGSVPDGWWRDRAGAAARLRDRLQRLAEHGLPADELDLPATHWFPEFVLVVEGKARAIGPASDRTQSTSTVRVIAARGEGDDAIVAEARAMIDRGNTVTVVTSDRELRERVEAAKASARGARWLLNAL